MQLGVGRRSGEARNAGKPAGLRWIVGQLASSSTEHPRVDRDSSRVLTGIPSQNDRANCPTSYINYTLLPTSSYGFLLAPTLEDIHSQYGEILGLGPGSPLSSVAIAQEVYIPTDGPTGRRKCPAEPEQSHAPEYTFTPYSHALTETLRYATSIPQSTITSTYAESSEALTSLVHSLSYTTWGAWEPEASSAPTDTDDPFGQAAWSSLWERANPPNFTEETSSLYSTTVSPTPIPSSELVLPPRDYSRPDRLLQLPRGIPLRRCQLRKPDRRRDGTTRQDPVADGHSHPG